MNDKLSGLYQRICDYSPDDGESAFTFTQRLAHDNGWNLNYARRVVEEYKKFMFLAVAAGHAVTPSEQVDQAWHLHLIYTRSYWDDFCSQVLGAPIHHGPTKGGEREEVKFHELYERTKSSYHELFRETPPPDIWPDATTRFGDDVQCVRVNTRHHWIVPKKRIQFCALAAVAIFASLAANADVFVDSGRLLRGLRLPPAEEVDASPELHLISDGFIRSAAWNAQVNDEVNDRDQSVARLFAQQNHSRSYPLVLGLAIGVVVAACVVIGSIVAVCVVVAAMLSGKCSACGRIRAMKKTGKTKRCTGWLASRKDEWKCNYCGAMAWTTHYIRCGGGCGGTSGCGGTFGCGNNGCGNSGCSGGGGCGGGGCGGGGCGGG